jgi:hypothetical protein
MLPWGCAKDCDRSGSTPHIILMRISNPLNHKDCLASSADFPANDVQPLDRDRHRDENFLSRRRVSIVVNAEKENTMATKLWCCADCGRLRACPYSPPHFPALVKYVGCSCGDVCVNESDRRTAALKAAIAKHLI